MLYTDEKDYIMRMIKEMARVLFSADAFGKKYVSVELERENKYQVAGNPLEDLLHMVDLGQINEAENLLLESSGLRSNREEVAAAALFLPVCGRKGHGISGKAWLLGRRGGFRAEAAVGKFRIWGAAGSG